ncbi:DUF5988 family protein [Streptomyces coffeae]|uniref:Uncharacterized protein n=1 Tax=Streptomyces coffeae TaxID=621382 RepID=A0ABS1NCH4_9ACTN|nr:DUF5988 family protein [Streptomyces coffeae]MBL1097635.1 hypothetical protein [Streptomyces coffeae]
MNEHIGFLADDTEVDVVLEGGPDDLPRAHQAERSSLTSRKLKIQHRDGYEHFELIGTGDDFTPATFRWTGRTKIAE